MTSIELFATSILLGQKLALDYIAPFGTLPI